MNKKFTTTRLKECYKSLYFAYQQLLFCNNNPYSWKWVIIGVHNSLQNFMMYSLRDDASGSILKAKQRNKYYINLRGQLPDQNSELDYFLELYKRIKNKNEYKNYPAKIFLPDKGDDEKIKKLNNYKNNFLHY